MSAPDAEDYWLEISADELADAYQSAGAAMKADWEFPIKALRHLMNCVLFMQLLGVRAAISEGTIQRDDARLLLRGEFGLGYLFGLAANFVDACGLDRQGAEAKAALLDVYHFTFGTLNGQNLLLEHNARLPSSFGADFDNGVERAHLDVNRFKRLLKGTDDTPPTGLRDGLLRLCNERRPP